jgi:hypothetical protein
MAKALLLILVAVVVLGSSADTQFCFTSAEVQNFTKGVLDGLETNPQTPGACYTGLTIFNTEAGQVVADLQKLLDGDLTVLTKLTTDLNTAADQLTSLETPCNLAGLIADIQALNGPDGQSLLIARYLKHSVAINNDLATLKTCSADAYACGKAVGDVVRNLVDFTITLKTGFLA